MLCTVRLVHGVLLNVNFWFEAGYLKQLFSLNLEHVRISVLLDIIRYLTYKKYLILTSVSVY